MKICIYIPGLTTGNETGSLDSYARAYTESLNRNSEKQYDYSVKFEKKALQNNSRQEFNIATVYKAPKNNLAMNDPIYRFYEYNYEDGFTKNIKDSNILIKSFRFVWSICKMFPIFIIRSFTKGLNAKQKLQSVYFFVILLIISIATALILPSIPGVILNGLPQWLKEKLPDTTQWGKMTHSAVIGYKYLSHSLIVLASVLALVLPNAQNTISNVATKYLCVHYYLKYGEGNHALIGGLADIIEKISKTEDAYESMEIHAYSFGSIIAIDTLFPRYPNKVDERISQEITQLVTIGCPFDFIRVYYRNYFANRTLSDNHIKYWYNINCMIDVLSSNFRNDTDTKNNIDGLTKITPGGVEVRNITYDVADMKNISIMDYLFLLYFRVHQMYWSKKSSETSFFTNYFNRLKTDNTL